MTYRIMGANKRLRDAEDPENNNNNQLSRPTFFAERQRVEAFLDHQPALLLDYLARKGTREMLEVLKQKLQPMGSSGAPEENGQATDAQREAAGFPGKQWMEEVEKRKNLYMSLHRCLVCGADRRKWTSLVSHIHIGVTTITTR